MESKKYRVEIFAGVFVFAMMFVFFSEAHPIVMFDGDDWGTISESRPALPKWGAWNPIKVLPETLYPSVGFFSAYFVAPFVGDYLTAFTISAAAIVSIFITAYIFLMILFLEKNFSLQRSAAIFLGLMFLLLHFAIFLQHDEFQNEYLFQVIDTTCYFHYLIPALLNASLVLLLSQIDTTKNFFSQADGKKILLVFAVYMAIFSNVLHSSILAIYIFVELLWKIRPKDFSPKKFFQENKFYCLILIFWSVSLIFEINGGRSHNLAKNIDTSFFENFISAAAAYFQSLAHNNRGAAFFIIAIVTVPFVWKNSADEFAEKILTAIKKFALCLPIWSLYTILAGAKAGIDYAVRRDVQIGIFFFLFVIVISAFAYWLKKNPHSMLIFPILIFALFTWTCSGTKNFAASNVKHLPEKTCQEINRYIVNELVAADKSGAEEFILLLPKWNDADNWPHPIYMGERYIRTLYSHGIISRQFKVTVEPDENLNKNFGLKGGE